MKRILVVDDEMLIRKFFPRALKFDNVEVMTAATLTEAKQLIDEYAFELVLTDLSLDGSEGEQGFEVITYAKSKSSGTSVILMTGYGSRRVEKKVSELGADFYLEKPVDINLLMDKAAEYCLLDDNAYSGREAKRVSN